MYKKNAKKGSPKSPWNDAEIKLVSKETSTAQAMIDLPRKTKQQIYQKRHVLRKAGKMKPSELGERMTNSRLENLATKKIGKGRNTPKPTTSISKSNLAPSGTVSIQYGQVAIILDKGVSSKVYVTATGVKIE